MQETFASVWRSAASYRPERGPAAPWLYAVARNAIVDRMRARTDTPGELPDSASTEPGPAERAESSYVSWRVQRAMEELPTRSGKSWSSRTGARCRRARSRASSGSRSARSRRDAQRPRSPRRSAGGGVRVTRTPDFDELVGRDFPASASGCSACTSMIVAAGPPPELAPELEAGPTLAMTLVKPKRELALRLHERHRQRRPASSSGASSAAALPRRSSRARGAGAARRGEDPARRARRSREWASFELPSSRSARRLSALRVLSSRCRAGSEDARDLALRHLASVRELQDFASSRRQLLDRALHAPRDVDDLGALGGPWLRRRGIRSPPGASVRAHPVDDRVARDGVERAPARARPVAAVERQTEANVSCTASSARCAVAQATQREAEYRTDVRGRAARNASRSWSATRTRRSESVSFLSPAASPRRLPQAAGKPRRRIQRESFMS